MWYSNGVERHVVRRWMGPSMTSGNPNLPARIEKIIFSRTAEMPKREKALIESAFFLAIFEYVPIVQDTFLDTILGNSRTLLFLLIFLLLLRPPYSNIFPNDIAFI